MSNEAQPEEAPEEERKVTYEEHEPLEFSVKIEKLNALGAIPEPRQIEKWIEIGLERHGNGGEVTVS